MDSDKVTVGDLTSSARGTGARKSEGKPQWWQFPVSVIPDILKGWDCAQNNRGNYGVPDTESVIRSIADWQQSAGSPAFGSLYSSTAMGQLLYLLAKEQGISTIVPSGGAPLRALESTVRVLEFGAAKYKPGNWAKGMPWSVCLSCALSHLFAAAGGEANDAESGLSHLAHAMCNLVFLKAYETLYPEGDDRLSEWSLQNKGTLRPKDPGTGPVSVFDKWAGFPFRKMWCDESGFHTENLLVSQVYKPDYIAPPGHGSAVRKPLPPGESL